MTVWIIKNEEDRKRFIRAVTIENIKTLPEELQLLSKEQRAEILKKDDTYDVLS